MLTVGLLWRQRTLQSIRHGRQFLPMPNGLPRVYKTSFWARFFLPYLHGTVTWPSLTWKTTWTMWFGAQRARLWISTSTRYTIEFLPKNLLWCLLCWSRCMFRRMHLSTSQCPRNPRHTSNHLSHPRPSRPDKSQPVSSSSWTGLTLPTTPRTPTILRALIRS